MLLLKFSDTQGGMFDEASEADISLHFANVGEGLFDAAAPAAATTGRSPTGPEYPLVYFGVAPFSARHYRVRAQTLP